ncbi:hypothetical protein [Jiangella alba]|uniref:Carboxypeptidase regulatory-like domain-containing protein n=1 Tax=Jiangella alba TaxID=561176 RepID=A0A1H5CCC8_9ACTN|nr:hypothetical protein [Jiangella alba]SED64439.1 hypothetical protein SAMN04488561_0164 [Jiangella alba]
MALRTPAAVVAVVLVAGCTGADPDEPGATPTAATSDSAELSEPVAVRGVITRADGTPVADALVQLVAEPADGPTATGGPVAAARTGADGAYELRIAADLRAALPVDDAGLVRFAVVVDSPDGIARTSWTGPGALTHPHTADLEVHPAG